jgi:hypothetical protein
MTRNVKNLGIMEIGENRENKENRGILWNIRDIGIYE